ncbi:MAG: LapA family protein [Coleofasciculus sp. C2-GNP5-27]
MKALTNLVTSVIVAAWIAAIAILSVQNATLVSLRFLNVESIKLPVGVVLAFSVGIGVIAGSIIPWVWQIEGRKRL